MKGQTTPYFMFNGNAKEALDFYKSVFGGEISELQTYAQAGYQHSPEAADRLIHGRFNSGDLFFMVSDSSPGSTIIAGNNISLVINLESDDEIQKIYDALKENGKVHMELQDTFWGACYAKVVDQYGIAWDLNYQKS
ncbi:VOC family protein [Neobacillus sp. LXY-1]|uniref:VOC family protein n=1 Tax=Neobacillus sp. LXY-1 TaxID=3379133 RepID=UPI003EE38C12